ncbi:TetR/AcrR family transcriptional regulator [Leptolyngbyaceae cyanobacterium CCMR0082]|uniref:TetR/AcrR family transcriptional regulator n=1 Tax=Adonisia turfae CCMR0082 TaxID=2304604 RepID=A0A6M0SFC0_9CYAN|nr:TetR/AcrR family transcriptional regulator [Adonisia turfae]NEZ67179.1 TetR/AcrR family transcriptional regulator [Adonisia turfae CCMR0082]
MEKENKSSKLTRQDWINQGLQTLAESGVEAVRVEPLAKCMGVTKGSFYWHFKNRDVFLEAILQEWVNGQTSRIIEQVETIGGDATTKLLYLFELAVQDDGRVENAIRAWATGDSKITTVLVEVDQQRLEYTKDLFLEVGFEPFEAMVRARMVYYALVGEFTIGARSDHAERLAEIRLQHAILTKKA